MRALALIAFFALQLSVFTCGFDIHVHAATADSDSKVAHLTNHMHDKNNSERGAIEHECHVHASHAFTALDAEESGKKLPLFSTVRHYTVAESSLKDLPFLIEHPPKIQHG